MALARRQGGAVSRFQVMSCGMSDEVLRRYLRDGLWTTVTRGVYAVSPDSFLQRAWAGVLVGGQHAVVGRVAAAYLHDLVREPPDVITIFTGLKLRDRPADRWEFVRGDRRGYGEPPRTRLADTVIDASGELDPDAVAALVERAVTQRHVRPAEITRLLADRPRARHRALLMDILGDTADGVHGPLENRYHHDVERAHGLPRATHQPRVGTPDAIDNLYPAYGLIVELDGVRYHQHTWADVERDVNHNTYGLTTLRFGWKHVAGNPCHVAGLVARALQAHGWTGTPVTCRHCGKDCKVFRRV